MFAEAAARGVLDVLGRGSVDRVDALFKTRSEVGNHQPMTTAMTMALLDAVAGVDDESADTARQGGVVLNADIGGALKHRQRQ